MSRAAPGRRGCAVHHRSGVLPARRRLLGAGLGLLAGMAAATPPAPRGSRPVPAEGALAGPARMLLVELRCLPRDPEREAAAAPVRGARSVGTAGATAPASGSVVVGTRDRREAGPTVAWRSSTARPQPPVLLQLRVANGQLARHSVVQVSREPVLDFVWLGGPPVVAAGSSSAGTAVALREQVRTTLQDLQVLPRWAGGAQPVQVWLLARRAGPCRADGSTDAMAEGLLETTLHLPPGQWVLVARSADPLSAGASGEPAMLAWQIRVTPQPE